MGVHTESTVFKVYLDLDLNAASKAKHGPWLSKEFEASVRYYHESISSEVSGSVHSLQKLQESGSKSQSSSEINTNQNTWRSLFSLAECHANINGLYC